jgi:hypothetical protein
MDVFKIATDEFIKDMCKNICRPGGTLPNPNVEELGAPNYDSLPWSSNFTHCRGVSYLVGILCCHLKCTSWPYLVQFYPAHIYSMIKIKKCKKEDKEMAKYLTAPTQIEDLKTICNAFKNIAEYLLQIRGTTGVPLTYVICEEEEEEDVPEGPDNHYQDAFKEMIACSPHDKESYAADIAQVWTIVI